MRGNQGDLFAKYWMGFTLAEEGKKWPIEVLANLIFEIVDVHFYAASIDD
jgi:hypothetical protein